jgi:two-component system osmolarity sensor histidine kinase EnvZ
VDAAPAFYLRDFAQALDQRTAGRHQILYDAARPDWRWVDIAMGGRALRVGFDTRRFATRIPLTLILMTLAGTLIAIVTSLLMVRRITRPLAALARASTRIGVGRRGEPLREEGAAELAELTRNFNQMERQLQVLMDNRTTLLAGISHDLRTPIARMQLELEFLEDNPDSEMIEGMRADLAEMDEIISAALQLSKGIADEITKQTAVCALIESVIGEHRHRDVAIEFRCAAEIHRDLPRIALRRVLNNLLDNAIRYGRGEPIEVRCEAVGERVRIEIIDRGPGIPEDQRAIVLQPFKLLEESRSRSLGGGGLGLAIVDQLCRMNDWRFELDAGDEGGTVARLSLP